MMRREVRATLPHVKVFASMDLQGPTLTPQDRGIAYRFLYRFLKGVNFVRRYSRNPRYAVLYLLSFWRKGYREHALFLTDEEFLKQAQTKSTIRLGEGEFTLMLGTRGLGLQGLDPALRDALYTIVRDYDETAPYILAIPPYVSISNQDLEARHARFLWMPGKVLFRMLFNKKAWYSDAVFFYRYGNPRLFLQTVTKDRRVVYVTNHSNLDALRKIESALTPEATGVAYVETPAAGTFDKRDEVLADIRAVIRGHEKEAAIIFACGPAGKVLASQLAQEGVLSHDVGAGISFLLTNTTYDHMTDWTAFEATFGRNRDHDRTHA